MRKKKRQGHIDRRRLLYSLQTRLQTMTFIIVLLPMLLAGWSSLHLLKKYLVRDMRWQLRSSVAAANLSYQHEVNRVERAVMAISLNNTVKTTLRLEIFGQLKREVDRLSHQYGLDFLLITNGLGEIQISPFPGHELNRDLYTHPVLYEAMTQNIYSGTMLEENGTLLHFLEMGGKDIEYVPVVAIEAASAIVVRDKVIGYILGGVMATSNQKLMARLQDSAGCRQVSLVAGNRIAAASIVPDGQLVRGGRFPEQLDFHSLHPSAEHLHKIISSSGRMDNVFEYHPLEMPGEDSLVALVCSYSLSRFYHLLSNIRMILGGIFIVGMILAMSLATLMSRSIAAPLHRLTKAMGKMREQGVYELLPAVRDDEIGELVTGYNRMVATIDERIRDLNQEVVQRRQAEHQLAAESERLHVILQSIADGVMAVDVEGRVVLLNRVAAELTGWKDKEVFGFNLETVFPVKSLRTGKPVGDFLVSILRDDQHPLVEGDLLLTVRDGREVQITKSASQLTDNSGKVIGAVIAFRDVSEQRLLEEELAKTKKLESVGVLAGGIAHDFNNLLTAILGNLSLLRMELAKDADLLQPLDEAEKASLRARDLTLQLLTFSRGGAPVKRSVDLSGLIRESAVFVARGTRVQIDFVVDADLLPAMVDKGQIGQVIDNLVINGIQAMPDGGKIIVSAVNVTIRADAFLPLAAGQYIKISVQDHGIGIKADIMDRIFDPYFTTKESGNGLGLSICYAIVNKHGGYIGSRSLVGKETVFDVYLPAVENEDEEEKTPVFDVELVKNQDMGRILVMDDEEMIRVVSQSMLQALGYDVVCVQDGDEAIHVYQEQMGTEMVFDAVILDMTIPGGMGGEETVGRLRTLDPSLKAIVSSGYTRHAIMASYQKYGFDGVIAKPYRLKDLSEVLQRVLG